MLTLLLLAGDPGDGVAWRSWCGFGDYLANSGIVNALRDLSATRGEGMTDVLEALAGGDAELGGAGFPEERNRVVEAYARGKEALNRLAGLTGEDLLRAVAEEVGGKGARVPEVLTVLCDPHEGDGARDLRERALRRLVLPGMLGGAAGPADGRRVVVGGAAALVGRSPRTVVACGLVNGFLPGHAFFDATRTPPGKVAKVRGECLRRAGLLLGKARERLVCTWFEQTDLETAGRLGLKVDRIWTDGGVRMASVGPSIALEAAGLVGRPGR